MTYYCFQCQQIVNPWLTDNFNCYTTVCNICHRHSLFSCAQLIELKRYNALHEISRHQLRWLFNQKINQEECEICNKKFLCYSGDIKTIYPLGLHQRV